MPDHDRSSMVKLWWWNPGGGAQCQEVPFEMVDDVREELRAEGAHTWITGSIPIRTN